MPALHPTTGLCYMLTDYTGVATGTQRPDLYRRTRDV